MSRGVWRRFFDDKLATRDVTFLCLALKTATENATDDEAREGTIPVTESRRSRDEFYRLIKGQGGVGEGRKRIVCLR